MSPLVLVATLAGIAAKRTPFTRPGWVGAGCSTRSAVRSSATDGAVAAISRWMDETGRGSVPVAVSEATTVPTLLADFWAQVCVTPEMAFPERAIAFPGMSMDARSFGRLLHHVNSCSEMSAVLGEDLFVAVRHPAAPNEGEPPAPAPMILLRSRGASADMPADEGWDDDWPDFELEAGSAEAAAASDEEVLAVTREWVEAVICHMKVCPFSVSADRAGLPAGGVKYPITRAATADEVYLAFWSQVDVLLSVCPGRPGRRGR